MDKIILHLVSTDESFHTFMWVKQETCDNAWSQFLHFLHYSDISLVNRATNVAELLWFVWVLALYGIHSFEEQELVLGGFYFCQLWIIISHRWPCTHLSFHLKHGQFLFAFHFRWLWEPLRIKNDLFTFI